MASISLKRKRVQRKCKTEMNVSNSNGSKKQKISNKTAEKNHFKCRICLGEGNVPIYGNKDSPEMSNDIKTFGDIELCEEDNFPKFICGECYSLLEGANKFRKTAKETQEFLKTSILSSQLPLFEETTNNLENYEVNDFDNIMVEFDDTQTYKCSVCDTNFKTSEDVDSHKKSHKLNLRIQCKLCPNLITVGKYKRHLLRHQTPSHSICEICGKTFRKDNLIRHLEMHGNKLPYQCPKCPYRGRLRDSLKIHMRCHTGSKPYSCDKCQAKFITRSNLNRHKLTHSKERLFKCIECGRSFYTKYDKDTHFKSDHSGVNFGCTSCGNKYGSRKALMRHELRVHKRDKMPRGRRPLYLEEEYKTNVSNNLQN